MTVQGQYGPAEIRDPWGYSGYMQYDTRGNMTRVERPHDHITTYSYDANDNLLTSTDAYGNTWTYQYDVKNNQTKRISPLGRETVTAYDARGQLTSVTDPHGNTTGFTYDSFGNVAAVTDALLNVTTFSYDTHGLRLLSKTDPQGRVTSYSYDANDRITRITYDNGSSIQYGYDALTLVSRTNENGVVFQHQHNKLLATTKVFDGMGNYTTYGYDAAGNMISHRDPLGNISSYTYDGYGNQLTGFNPLMHKQSFEYDARGLMTGFTDERGNTTSFLHDGNRFLRSIGGGPGYTYDNAGRLSSRYSIRSNTAQTYNEDGQLDQIIHDGVPAGTFAYDAAGNMSGFSDWAGNTGFVHDSLNRMTGINYADGLDISFTLLADGLPSVIHYPGSTDVSYSYDGRQRVTGISWSGGSVSLAYDPAGRVISITRSNGTTSDYSYDVTGRITNISHRKGIIPFATMSYVRDAAGNIIQESADLPLIADLPDQDIHVTYNAANQLATYAGNTCSYDIDGNLTSMNDSRNLTASYDAENRLSSLSLSSVINTFSYNLLGQRVKTQRNSTVRNLHRDHNNRLLFETDTNGAVTTMYIYSGPRPLAMLRGGETYFYHYDQLGSVVALTDSTGTVKAAYIHSPFGVNLAQNGTIENPFTWLGALGVEDDGEGIYYMTNRHYDAHSARFLQKDPSGFNGGHNLYAYAGNNPVNLVDPLGLNWLGDTTAVGNMTIGLMLFGLKAGAAITAPTWGGVFLCGAGAVLGLSRILSVIDNRDYYQDPAYDGWDAGADIIDPTRVGRNRLIPGMESGTSWWLDDPGNDTDYGNLKSSTPDISFPEFTIPEFSLD
jgi:RHS repeat-associated protein